jgi:hypothetical protein
VKTVDQRLEDELNRAKIPFTRHLQQTGTSVGYLVAGIIGVSVHAPGGRRPRIRITTETDECVIDCTRLALPDVESVWASIVRRAVDQINGLPYD